VTLGIFSSSKGDRLGPVSQDAGHGKMRPKLVRDVDEWVFGEPGGSEGFS